MGSCLSGRRREESDLVHSASDEHEEEKISVQCVDDPVPLKPMVYYDDDEIFRMMHHSPGSCLSGRSREERDLVHSASDEHEEEKVDAGGEDLTSEFAVLNI